MEEIQKIGRKNKSKTQLQRNSIEWFKRGFSWQSSWSAANRFTKTTTSNGWRSPRAPRPDEETTTLCGRSSRVQLLCSSAKKTDWIEPRTGLVSRGTWSCASPKHHHANLRRRSLALWKAWSETEQGPALLCRSIEPDGVCVCVKKHVQNLELLTVLHLLMRDQDFQSLMPDTYSTSIAASGPSHFLMPIRPSTSFSFLSSCPIFFWSKEMQTKINWHLLLTVIIRDSAIEEFTLKIHYVHWPSSIWNRHGSVKVPPAVFGPHPAKEKLKCCQNNGPHITQTIGSHHWGNAHPQFI